MYSDNISNLSCVQTANLYKMLNEKYHMQITAITQKLNFFSFRFILTALFLTLFEQFTLCNETRNEIL